IAPNGRGVDRNDWLSLRRVCVDEMLGKEGSMKVNPLFGVFLSILGCGESPDSFSIRGTDEDTDIETDSHSNTERESTEIYESDTTPRISSEIDKETDMDTLENTDMDTDTDMVTETDNDICTDTDMDVETDTDVYEDTDADTDTDDIHAPLCQLDDPIQTDLVCRLLLEKKKQKNYPTLRIHHNIRLF